MADGALARAWRRLFGAAPPKKQILDAESEIALHVARHEAESRSHVLAPLHVLYGLLQDEGFVAAVAALGGDAGAIEDRVLAELDARDRAARDDAMDVVSRAAGTAVYHGRLLTCTDLWCPLARTSAGALVTAGGIDAAALTFQLVHGRAEPPLAPPPGEVHVELRNDDYSTKELVVHVLRDVFELAEQRAVTLMETVHQQGSAIVGRFPGNVAVGKVAAARAIARDHGFPLWIALDLS